MSSGLIIVVDDNPTFRKMYSDFLSAHGYTVMTAGSGAECVKMLHNCKPKVLILDISMPGMDGIETCKKIRKLHGSDIPIIFLTAFNDVDKLRDCMHAGGDDYLIKTGKLDNVLERVRYWSAEANRSQARERRTDVVQEVDDAKERIDQAADLSQAFKQKDEQMSRLMATAQSLADEAKLTGREAKLYLYGYAAGIVSHWADSQSGVKDRYMDYLQAALTGSYHLKREDIREVMANYSAISMEPLFKTAYDRARADSQESDEAAVDAKASPSWTSHGDITRMSAG